MGNSSKETGIKMKVYPKGQVVIPVSLRKKYNIEIGDHIDVITESEGILLKPEIEEQPKTSFTKQLFGIFNDYAKVLPYLNEDTINASTEDEFTKGWKK